MTAEHTVSFTPSGRSARAAAGTTLREAAALAGVALDAACGGLGTCGRCVVRASGALEAPGADELVLLGPDRIAGGERLACRARVAGDVEVLVAPVDHATLQIVGAEGAFSTGHAAGGPLGIAIDVGTTTLALALVDASGALLSQAAALNPQHVFGADVMSRISAAAVHGVEALRVPLVTELDRLAREALAVAERDVGEVGAVAVCGNTTMMHAFLGIDPAPLGEAPYAPAFLDAVERPVPELGLLRESAAMAFVLPGASAFVGADVVAGLLATELDERETPAILLDLGTNGEIVLRTRDRLLATSAAAGPALEAAGISAGMLAEAGAIERVELAGERLVLGVIGGGQPRGICGSGLIDLVAALLDASVLDATGRLLAGCGHELCRRVREDTGMRVFDVAPGVVLTQADVRSLQLAIAAIAAGVGELLHSAGQDAADVEELVIAGGFGSRVRARALARLGAIPGEWADRASGAGNAALAGAVAVLVHPELRGRASALAAHIETVDLAAQPGFQARFIGAMTFPQV